MPKIKVFPFTYYDAEQGIRREGAGMCTEEKINKMKNSDLIKDHQFVESCGVEIDESELTETDRYYPPIGD